MSMLPRCGDRGRCIFLCFSAANLFFGTVSYTAGRLLTALATLALDGAGLTSLAVCVADGDAGNRRQSILALLWQGKVRGLGSPLSIPKQVDASGSASNTRSPPRRCVSQSWDTLDEHRAAATMPVSARSRQRLRARETICAVPGVTWSTTRQRAATVEESLGCAMTTCVPSVLVASARPLFTFAIFTRPWSARASNTLAVILCTTG